MFKQVIMIRTWINQARRKMSSEDTNEPLFQSNDSNQTSKDQDAQTTLAPECLFEDFTQMYLSRPH